MPTVSVIVPNYNHAPYLKQRIESILNQTFQDFELILLDDCSTDNSREVLEAYRNDPHVTHIEYNVTNSGSPFRQWDKGMGLASGRWVWIAESDDWAEPTFLARLLNEVADEPDCALAYSATWWVDEQGNKEWDLHCTGQTTVYDGKEYIAKQMAVSNMIFNVSECLIRRDCFRSSEVQRYEWMKLCGDWMFYILLAERGSVLYLDTPLSYYRQHGDNISLSSESKGLSFTEGASILDYLIERHNLKLNRYAREWGRKWAKYEQIHHFPREAKRIVWQRMRRYPSIVAWYLIYKLKRKAR